MKTGDEMTVKELLLLWRDRKAEYSYLQTRLRMNKPLAPTQIRRMNELEEWLACIDSLLMILNEDEAFVIQRHLIDEIDWNRIAAEYGSKWGNENIKCRRTLIRYQKTALDKLEKAMKVISIPSI